MTLDEMQIVISASAEDALATMDAVIVKIEQLVQTAEGGGAGFDVKLDTGEAEARVAQLGDTIKTAAGQSAEAVKVAADKIQDTVGQVSPAVRTAFDVSEPVEKVVEKLDTLSDAAGEAGEAAAKGFGAGKVAAESFSGTLSKLGSGILQGLVTGGTTALVTFAINGISSLITALINAKANAEAAAEALRKEHQETADALEEERAGLEALASEYETLSGKSNRTLDEENRMYQLQQALREEYGITSNSVLGLAGSYDSLTEAIKAAREAQAAQSSEALAAVAEDAGNVATEKTIAGYKKLADLQKQYLESLEPKNRSDFDAGGPSTAELAASIEKQQETLSSYSDDYVAWFAALTAKNAAEVKAAGQTWNDELAAVLTAAFNVDPSAYTDQNALQTFVLDSANALMTAVRGPEVSAALDAAEAFHNKIVAGYVPTEAEYEEVAQSYDTLREAITGALRELYDDPNLQAGDSRVTAILSMLGIPEAVPQSWEEYQALVNQLDLENARTQAEALATSLNKLNQSADDQAGMAAHIREWQSASDAYRNAATGSHEANAAFARMQAAAEALGYTLHDSADNLDLVNGGVKTLAAGLEPELAALETQLTGLQEQYRAILAEGGDAGAILAQMDAVIAKIVELKGTAESAAGWYGLLFNADAISAAMGSAEAQEALGVIDDLHDAILNGYTPTEEDYETVRGAYDTLREIIAQALREAGEDVDAESERVTDALDAMVPSEAAARDASAFFAAIDAQKLATAKKNADALAKSVDTLNDEVKSRTAMANHIRDWKDASEAYKKAASEGKATRAQWNAMEAAAAALGYKLDNSSESIARVDEGVKAMGEDLQSQATSMENELASLTQQFMNLDAVSDVNGELTADASDILSKISIVRAALEGLRLLMKALGFDVGSGGGGGGGGGGSSKNTPVATVTESPYDKAIASLEHLKALDKETLEQELAYLQEINQNATRYKLTTEERLDLEERIYDVQKAIAARDAEDLDTLANGVVDALGARYEAMRDTELAALDESRSAWETWRDSNVAAIQAQIDAIDALTEAEDREATDAEKQRKIASLQQQLEYEQDAYNRAKLQQQLTAAQDSYASWLAQNEREDQKAALEAQIEAINQRADAELSALDQRQEEIEAVYEARLQTAALEAEAEKELASSSQQEIIDLIAAYAPDYNATGETLGEQLYEGFKSKVGDIAAYVENLNALIQTAQDDLAAQVQAAADSFYQQASEGAAASALAASGVTINQTNQFYTPVETPSQTAWKIRQANEDLALSLLNG